MDQGQRFNLIIGDCTLPLDIHSLALDRDGGSVGCERPAFSFRFAYRHIPFLARYSEADDSRIEVRGDLGPLPFTAESALARAQLPVVLHSANSDLGQRFQVSGGRIEVVGHLEVPPPVTAVGLVSAITRFLLPIKPYLETIEVFLRLPAKAARTGQTALRSGWRPGPVRHRR